MNRRPRPSARAAGRRRAGRAAAARSPTSTTPAWRRSTRIGREAVAAYAGSNGLDPTAFPSLLSDGERPGRVRLRLLDGPGRRPSAPSPAAGPSRCCSPCRALATAGPTSTRPRMVLPMTAHAAFHKAAHYFGVEAVLVDVDEEFRARPEAMAAAIDDRTVLVVASAPSYAHGVVDPVTEIAAAAAARGVRCHVDACIGGWVLPYAARLGRPRAARGPSRSTASPASRWTCTSTPTPPRAPRCCCTATPALRRPQFFASARWPGYTMLNPTMQSTKSGGPLAGAWAVVHDDRRRGLPRADRAGARRRSTGSWPGSRRSTACGSSYARTRRWSPSPPTRPATSSRSPTR